MTAIASDFRALNFRLRQLRGDAPSGRYFVPGKDGKYELIEDGHEWDWCRDACHRCGFTHMEVLERTGPAACPGVLPKVRTKIKEDAHSVTYMQPDGMRYIELKPVPFPNGHDDALLEQYWNTPFVVVERTSPSPEVCGTCFTMTYVDEHGLVSRGVPPNSVYSRPPPMIPNFDLAKAMAEMYRELFETLGPITAEQRQRSRDDGFHQFAENYPE